MSQDYFRAFGHQNSFRAFLSFPIQVECWMVEALWKLKNIIKSVQVKKKNRARSYKIQVIIGLLCTRDPSQSI